VLLAWTEVVAKEAVEDGKLRVEEVAAPGP